MLPFLLIFAFVSFMIWAMITKRIVITSFIGGILGFIMFISSWVGYGDNLFGFWSAMFLTVCAVVMIATYSYMWLHDELQKEQVQIP